EARLLHPHAFERGRAPVEVVRLQPLVDGLHDLGPEDLLERCDVTLDRVVALERGRHVVLAVLDGQVDLVLAGTAALGVPGLPVHRVALGERLADDTGDAALRGDDPELDGRAVEAGDVRRRLLRVGASGEGGWARGADGQG